MAEHTEEPLWVGMDVDAELARYREEDRRRKAKTMTPPSEGGSSWRRALRAAASTLGRKSRAPRAPLPV